MNLIGTKELETERLILRRLRKEDAERAYENWCSNDNVCKYLSWDKHKNIKVTEKLYEIWEEEYKRTDTFRWIVELKATNEVIGTIDVPSRKYLKYDTFEIGYCYGEKFWGNGYATEALKAVIKYLFEEVKAEVVFAKYISSNIRSGRVMEKAGLIYDGEEREQSFNKDSYRENLKSYSLTKKEYLSHKNIK